MGVKKADMCVYPDLVQISPRRHLWQRFKEEEAIIAGLELLVLVKEEGGGEEGMMHFVGIDMKDSA